MSLLLRKPREIEQTISAIVQVENLSIHHAYTPWKTSQYTICTITRTPATGLSLYDQNSTECYSHART